MIPAPGSHSAAGFTVPAVPTAHSVGGRVIPVTVLSSLGNNSWQLSVEGRTVVATSLLKLIPGQTVLTRVEHAAESVFLRLVAPPGLTAFLERHMLPNDGIMRAVVEAFMRSGLPLDPPALRRARASLSSSAGPRSPAERARLMAEAMRRGLDLSTDALDALAGRSGGEYDHDRSKDREQKRRFHSERDLVEHAVTRVTEEPDHPVQFFNMQRANAGEHWVVIPFSYDDEETTYGAVLRLLLSRDPDRVIRAALSVDAERGRWGFEWECGPGGEGDSRVMRLFAPEGEGVSSHAATVDRSDPAFRRLEQVLRELGINSVDIGDSGESFDGFSSELPMDIMRGVQVEA
ncbi:MAG: hypothetical protein EA403_06125 [Spirochaetaceae bacterium]|nr:MAG: hypothetical protein EA403_06125 [Spirochaetaceae bacterium]